MEKSGKRGKIPQSDWPLIMARYEAGETLASIARTYDCSPPAISYVVSRSRTRQPAPTAIAAKPPPTPEPQLIKSPPSEAVSAAPKLPLAEPEPMPSVTHDSPEHVAAPPAARTNGHTEGPAPVAGAPHDGQRSAMPPSAEPRPQNPSWQRPTAPSAPVNGDHRRTLHLSLGNPTHGHQGNGAAQNGAGHNGGTAHNGNGHHGAPEMAARPGLSDSHNGGGDRLHHEPPAQRPEPPRPVASHEPILRGDVGPSHRKDAPSAFLDQELRTRVEGDITAFLAAFDIAMAEDTLESRSALREATDRLLRAGARTRIELERLEARVPLPQRDNGGRAQPAWRDR